MPKFFLFALLVLTGTSVIGGESLAALLQKRTLDLDTPREPSLAGALSELATRYKAKYNEELRVFISVQLLPGSTAPKPKPKTLPAIPGIEHPEPLTFDPADARPGGRPYKVPIVEALRYYAGLSNTTFTVRDDTILFHRRK